MDVPEEAEMPQCSGEPSNLIRIMPAKGRNHELCISWWIC